MDARIVANERIAPGYYRLRLDIGAIANCIDPGQFFTVRCGEGPDPLLRRPFGVHRIGEQRTEDRGQKKIEILYKTVGKATELLSRKKKGGILDIIGPLGNGFPIRLSAKRYPLNAILVAGGHGVAPLVALAESVSRLAGCQLPVAIIGAKTGSEILCEKDFKKLGFKILIATEDGSKGKKGLVTEALKDFLCNMKSSNRPAGQPANRPTIYACGPNVMLKEITRITRQKKIQAFGSFEEHMACAVGSCYGCVIETKDGYRRVCKDGPVFNLRDIRW